MFTKDDLYKRSELHDQYGGQMQGGISTPAKFNFIMLFTSPTGEQYGYKDGWVNDQTFIYTGEGQVGNMSFVRGNLAIRDHMANKKDLHLFEYTKKSGFVRYVGQMVFQGFEYRKGPDIEGNQRQIIVFQLKPID